MNALIKCTSSNMGVHSLWEIVGPTARPVRLETLNNRRMAVDASIWIYQFLKAVRDRDGNSLKHAHIVGFFRRICKLMYFGIKPVFVFDGGVPKLKKKTIQRRKDARQGKRESMEKTAQKLLAIQIHGSPRKKTKTAAAPKQVFDEYDLPHMEKYDGTRDERVGTTEEEFKAFTDTIDELEGIDLNSINPNSPEFLLLPHATQYMVLSTLRVRSRLRTGYTREQFEDMFPTDLEFSKFQINGVQRRNFFTQRLLDITGNGDKLCKDPKMLATTVGASHRVAGEKDRQYKLEKVDGGWSLSLHDEGSTKERAINLDEELGKKENEEEDDVEWEDVDITKKEDVVIDYSINGSLLGKTEVTDGGQSFLDTRHLSPVKRKRVESEDEEDEYQQQIREIEAMENLLKKNIPVEKSIPSSCLPVYKPSYEQPAPEYAPKMHEEAEQLRHIVGSLSNEQDVFSTNQPELPEEGLLQNKSFLKGGSLLFGNSTNEEEQSQVEDKSNKPLQESSKQNSAVPWFSESRIDNPFATSFVSNETPQAPALTEDERAGLVSWNVAKEILKETSSKDNVEVVELESDEDWEEVPLLHKAEKETKAEAIEISDSENEVEDGVIPKNKNVGNVNEATADVLNHPNIPFQSESLDNDQNYVVQKESFQPVNLTIDDHVSTIRDEQSQDTGEAQEAMPLEASLVPLTKDNHQEEQSIYPSDDAESPTPDQPQTEPLFEYDFSEEEEAALVEQLQKEASEFNDFKSTLNPNTFFEEDLNEQLKRDKRDADEVTTTMIQDVQELLTTFGIPYITAPMEAEAQCAELLTLKLVDGIITDDSDVFLFGNNVKVYRNMFHEKHYVEFYSSDALSTDLKLNRSRLIWLAELLGSDYTPGLKGIGPVNAMEILAEFEKAQDFQQWFKEGLLTDSSKEKPFLKTLRRKLVNNQHLLDNFPNPEVQDAYLYPTVDHDSTKFIWGRPDLDRIRSFLMERVGWSKSKADEVLVPLIKDINKKKTQQQNSQHSIEEFFSVESRHRVDRSKRLQKATRKLQK